MTEKKRIDEIDIARFTGICLVVLQHTGDLKADALNFAMSFMMPLFLVLSGYTSGIKKERKQSFKVFFEKKFRSIALPYLYFSAIYLLINICLYLIPSGPADSSRIKDILIQTFTFYGYSVLWFLSALFFSHLIMQALLRSSKKIRLFFFLLLAALSIIASLAVMPFGTWWYSAEGVQHSLAETVLYYLINAVMRLPLCTLYVFGGYFAGSVFRYPRAKKKIPAILAHLAAAVILYILCYLAAVKNEGGSLAIFYYGKNILLFVLASLLGIAATLSLSHAIVLCGIKNMIRPLSYFGKNSLIILLTHFEFYLVIPAVKLSFLIPFVNSHNITRIIAMLIILMIIEIPAIEIINRFLPFLLGRKTTRSFSHTES